MQTHLPCKLCKLYSGPQDVDPRGRMREVEGGICKSVIKSGRLSAKLPNLSAPLGSTSCDPD